MQLIRTSVDNPLHPVSTSLPLSLSLHHHHHNKTELNRPDSNMAPYFNKRLNKPAMNALLKPSFLTCYFSALSENWLGFEEAFCSIRMYSICQVLLTFIGTHIVFTGKFILG